MSDKWSDNLSFAAPGTCQPTTVAALMRRLKLTGAAADVQAAAIAEWVATHEPSEMMRYSLRARGLGHLLG